MKRMGMAVRLRPEHASSYRRLHEAVWPPVLAQIASSRIRNHTIVLRKPENLLFASLEYHGDDFDADMRRMAADPQTQRWWALTSPCQDPIESRKDGEWWAAMEEVFHVD